MTLSLGDQFVPGPVSEHRGDERAEFVEGLGTRGQCVESRILELFGLTEPGAQAVPLPGGHHTDPDESIGAREDRVEVLVARSAPPALTRRAGGRRLALGSERRPVGL